VRHDFPLDIDQWLEGASAAVPNVRAARALPGLGKHAIQAPRPVMLGCFLLHSSNYRGPTTTTGPGSTSCVRYGAACRAGRCLGAAEEGRRFRDTWPRACTCPCSLRKWRVAKPRATQRLRSTATALLRRYPRSRLSLLDPIVFLA
jgi:hypothetical protein